MLRIRPFMTIGALFLIAACGSTKTDKPSGPAADNKQQGLGASNSQAGGVGGAAGAGGGFQLPPGPLFKASYDINVKAMGIDVCAGKADLLVTNKFTVEIPQAKISCLANLCQFDLASALAGVSQGQGTQGLLSTAKIENGILKLGSIMGMTFNPPRPVFLVPFSMTQKELSQINVSQPTTVSGPAGTDSGTIDLRVTSVDERLTAGDGLVYNKVLRWEMTTTGFETVKPQGLLFDRIAFAWGLEPISIPSIEISGRLSDMMKMAGGGAGGAGGASGGCNIPLLGGLGGGAAGGGGLGGVLGGGGLGAAVGVITKLTTFTASLKMTSQTSLDPTKP